MFKNSKNSKREPLDLEALNAQLQGPLAKDVASLGPTLRLSLVFDLESSSTDWRQVSTLALENGVSESMVSLVMKQLERDGLVRTPLRASEEEQTWFRLVSRGLTSGERLRKLKGTLSGES